MSKEFNRLVGVITTRKDGNQTSIEVTPSLKGALAGAAAGAALGEFLFPLGGGLPGAAIGGAIGFFLGPDD